MGGTGTASTTLTADGNVAAQATAFGGNGGSGGFSNTGFGAIGGVANATALTTGTGTAAGLSAVSATATASGGSGGSAGNGANGGAANATANATGVGPDPVAAVAKASGGFAGGTSATGGLLATNGNATANAVGSGLGITTATATATGFLSNSSQLAGNAWATATANGSWQNAQANATATGAAGSATANTNSFASGLITQLSGQSVAAISGGTSESESLTMIGQAASSLSLSSSLQAGALGIGSPVASNVTTAWAGDGLVQAAFEHPSAVQGLGIFGGSDTSNAPSSALGYQTELTYTLNSRDGRFRRFACRLAQSDNYRSRSAELRLHHVRDFSERQQRL